MAFFGCKGVEGGMQLEVFKGLGGVYIECNQRERARLIKFPPAHGNNTHRCKKKLCLMMI